MSKKNIKVFGSNTGEDELFYLRQVLEREWLGAGPMTTSFESSFRDKRSLPNFVMLNSGSNALYLACHLLKIPAKSEIILPSFTWLACAHAIILAGHIPVFCDVDINTQNVSAQTILPHITAKTGAIMVVHYAGKPVDMDPILALGLPVIEDAAHAVDSKTENGVCGSLGTIGVYSFDGIKNIAAGEAGGLTSSNEEIASMAKSLRYCGIEKSGIQQSKNRDRWWEYDIQEVFPKMMPNDLSSAVALAQLNKLNRLQERRKQIWERYQEEFHKYEWIERPIDENKGEKHSYFTYLIRVQERDKLAKKLLEKGIYTNLRYHPLHLNKIYGQESKRLPNTERLNETGLNIPLHPKLSEDDVSFVIENVLKHKI